MDKETIKAFILWLESASFEEIDNRKIAFKDTALAVSSYEAKADIRLGLRLIDEELIARLELKHAHIK
ncbi:hypothetical protein MNBD_GAMMA11-1335 [hydrothermal vent metagenome]|uniref:Uncharacterized protein n=1 Tax=hydrothermal vent metagenome TaxID=652676 RepID=A0A3B0X8U4_9ZZZZ